MSIVPNPYVIEPAFIAPVVTILVPPTEILSRYVESVSTFVILIVPASLIRTPSPDATAVVPLEHDPSLETYRTYQRVYFVSNSKNGLIDGLKHYRFFKS